MNTAPGSSSPAGGSPIDTDGVGLSDNKEVRVGTVQGIAADGTVVDRQVACDLDLDDTGGDA